MSEAKQPLAVPRELVGAPICRDHSDLVLGIF